MIEPAHYQATSQMKILVDDVNIKRLKGK